MFFHADNDIVISMIQTVWITTVTLMTSQSSDTETSIFYGLVVLIRSLDFVGWQWLSFNRHSKYSSPFHGIWVRLSFYTACCVHKMAKVTVTGPPGLPRSELAAWSCRVVNRNHQLKTRPDRNWKIYHYLTFSTCIPWLMLYLVFNNVHSL